jgi:reactive intermediate/imine deaminase
MKIAAIIVTALALAAAAPWVRADTRPAIERLPTVTVNGRPMPFSAGVRVGDMLYLSGQIGLGADDKLPPGIEAQTRNTLDRIGATLKSAGLGWKDVVRCAVFLNDMANWPAFNTIYAGYVDPAHLPARSALGSTGLALGALVEVQCEAYDPPH